MCIYIYANIHTNTYTNICSNTCTNTYTNDMDYKGGGGLRPPPPFMVMVMLYVFASNGYLALLLAPLPWLLVVGPIIITSMLSRGGVRGWWGSKFAKTYFFRGQPGGSGGGLGRPWEAPASHTDPSNPLKTVFQSKLGAQAVPKPGTWFIRKLMKRRIFWEKIIFVDPRGGGFAGI